MKIIKPKNFFELDFAHRLRFVFVIVAWLVYGGVMIGVVDYISVEGNDRM